MIRFPPGIPEIPIDFDVDETPVSKTIDESSEQDHDSFSFSMKRLDSRQNSRAESPTFQGHRKHDVNAFGTQVGDALTDLPSDGMTSRDASPRRRLQHSPKKDLKTSSKSSKLEAILKKRVDIFSSTAKTSTDVDEMHKLYAYRRFVNDFIIPIKEYADIVWEEAKLRAFIKEARKYGAATRIISRFRVYVKVFFHFDLSNRR